MGKKRDSLALSGGEGGLGKEDLRTEHRRKDEMTNDIGAGEAVREHKKKKKKREKTEGQAPTAGPIGNGTSAPIQKSHIEKTKDKKDTNGPAVEADAKGGSLALGQSQQGAVKKAAEKGIETGGGKLGKTERNNLSEKNRKERKEGEGKLGDKGERGRAVTSGLEDRSPAFDQPQRKASERAAEKGVEQKEGAEREGRPEKKRKKKREGEGKPETKKEGEEKTNEELERPPTASAAAEAEGGGPAPAGSPAGEAGADVSKRGPEMAAGVESGEVGGAEEKPGKGRAKKAGVKEEGGGKAKAKKGAEGPAEKDQAPFDVWGKYFEGRWQGFWRPSPVPGTNPYPNGAKRKGGDEARAGAEGGGEGQQGAGNGEKGSKRQKKEAGKALETGLKGGPAEPGIDAEQEVGGERASKFLIRGPLPCHVEGCRLPARYGNQKGGSKLVPDSCSAHKAPGMKERKSAVCEVAGCTKAACYKHADETKKIRCAGHKEEGMVH